ncbi:tyrosine-type recombinase/integrase [endosymbiont GvMRE of Glomus versiforme]|uniref:tyrosine-type recombinase/integrase n=1 Tax=endosymbiont GvMRE of Glomus versiforme TaxID=2039283 RepID=UPI000EE3B9B8|nr:tyrosine-type recombinase/integrase [endosymbiont GvMRE of Glomus versiforme]RHZ35639.1 Tyrosine recombinase XerC [endosymbiont GvMRE of Glomus versiforme]
MKNNLTNYINWLQERNRSATTIKTYTETLQRFKQVITTETIKVFLKQNLSKYQPNTLKVFRQALSSYAKFAQIKIAWERISGIIPKTSRKFFSTLDQEELSLLKQANPEKNETTYQRNNLILDFLFYSGIRVSELVNIKHSDWQGKSLRVHGKGNKVRQVLLPPFLMGYFNPFSSDYLFTNQKNQPLTTLVIRQIIQARIKKAGLDKPITPHTFRRSFATLLHNKGTNLTTIQQLLGHESITTTEKYIQNDFEYIYADYSKLWRNQPNFKPYETP